MGSDVTAVDREAPLSRYGCGKACGHHAARRAVLAAGAALFLVAGGCGSSRLTMIRNEVAFNELVLKADRPVVVEFSKGGCVWCMFMDSRMDALVDEYWGRVVFARFELVDFWHRVVSQTLWRRYRVAFYPTVILFVGGKEKTRWVVDYNADNYRKVLDEAVGPPTPKAVPPGG